MQQTIFEVPSFSIELNGKPHVCKAFERAGRTLYRIVFAKTCLFLTQAKAPDGTVFWTAIPENTKINHLVQELGSLIENHFK